MAKTSHKRFIKKEKNKVKLKGQKLLPKGQNVTNTSFKVKKIVIKEQLKEHSTSDILSKKKLNVKELVSRLDHHNLTMRRESLLGLKQVAEMYSKDALERYLPALLQAAANLTIDIEADVRADALKLLSAVLQLVSVDQLLPLFPILSSYLVCAMTHIEIRIREDSLQLLDILLSTAPQLVASQADTLLPRFLDLISVKSGNKGRTLSLHLGGKVTAEKWRARVLYRLWKLLASVYARNKKLGLMNGGKIEAPVLSKNIIWDDKKPLHCTLYSEIYFQSCPDNLSVGGQKSVDESDTSNTNTQEYAEKLIPLLLDIFAEVAPQKKKVNFDNQNQHEISVEASVLLQCIVDIVLLLWDLLKNCDDDGALLSWFRKRHGVKLCQRLLEGRFPYETSQLISSSKSKKIKKEVSALLSAVEGTQQANDGRCLLQNLGLARLLLILDLSEPALKQTQALVVSFLKNCLRSCGSLDIGQCSMLQSCLEAVCTIKRYELDAPVILGSVASLTKHYKQLDRAFSCMLFDFLTGIALDCKLSRLHGVDAFKVWLSNLPELLTFSSIHYKTIRTISSISSRGNTAFSSGLDGWIESILDNVVTIKIITDNEEENEPARREIVSLLYWVKDWDKDVVSNLGKAVTSNFLGPELTSHLIDILQLKTTNDPEGPLPSLLNEEEWWHKSKR